MTCPACEVALGNGLTLVGYSRSGDRTEFFVPELGVLLDAGCPTHESSSHVFLTHSHLDHTQGLPGVLFHRKGRLPTTIFGPAHMMPFVHRFLRSYFQLNTCKADLDPSRWYRLVGVGGGDQFCLRVGRKVVVEAMTCNHSVPTLGYLFAEVRPKLRGKYKELDGPEIARLRGEGVPVSQPTLTSLFAYLGDTSVDVFETNPQVFNYPVIIVECSFLSPKHHQHAEDKQHISFQDLRLVVESHPQTRFVLTHFSLRYSDEEVREFFHQIDLPNVVPAIPKQSEHRRVKGEEERVPSQDHPPR